MKIVVRLSVAWLLLCLSNYVSAANWVKQIRSNSLNDKLQIVIDLEKNPDFKVFSLSNPVRLVVDVQGRPVIDFSNRLSFKSRGVSKVRTGMNENDKVRVVLDLLHDYKWKAYEMKPEGNRGHRVVVEVFDHPELLAKSRRQPNKEAAVKTGTTVSNQQLVLESTKDSAVNAQQLQASAKAPSPTPTIKEASDVLRSETPQEATVASIAPPTSVAQPPITEVVEVVEVIAPEQAVTDAPAIVMETTPASTTVVDTPPSATVPQDAPLVAAVTPKPTGSIFDDPSFKTSAPKPSASAVEPIETSPVATTPKPRKSSRKTLLIMIDPGHGGKDPGAIGKGGTREKHIVLQIAKRLKRRIGETYGMKAVLTRNTDKYITLRGRLMQASSRRPDLFVSIHADAAQNRSAKGSSVYILSNRGASSKTAKWIAKRENAVDAKYGSSIEDFSSDVDNFLLGMQQDITIESSHALASKTLKRLKGIGKLHKRRVERAGFAVLKASKIPSMLVETAFLSNPEEEKKLKKPSYQEEIAEAIATGIEEYFRAQGKL